MESLTAAIGRLLGSPAFKFFLICGLILVLTIPLLLVWGLIGEREQRAEGVTPERSAGVGRLAVHRRSAADRALHGEARNRRR